MEVATATKLWTLHEVHSLPDDGNTYELVHGVLYVTPPPLEVHETIAARLSEILGPYVAKHRLGLIYRPRAVFRIGKDVEVEPDLMVRQPHPNPRRTDDDWETAPTPILVVEILSSSTRRRDFEVKRTVYLEEARIPEYWIVDAERKEVRVHHRDGKPVDVIDVLAWSPQGPSEPLTIDLDRVFQRVGS